MISCKDCIYGGMMINSDGDVVRTLASAIKSGCPNGGFVTIDYTKGDPGCRADAFKSKEDVCINNGFSEFVRGLDQTNISKRNCPLC